MRSALLTGLLTLITFLGTSLYVETFGALELIRTNNQILNVTSVVLSTAVILCLIYLYDRSKYEVFSLLERKNQ
jgi:uncharacterized membrane protein